MKKGFNKDKQMNIRVTESQIRVMKVLKKEMNYNYGTAIDYFIKEQKSTRALKVTIHELEELKKDYQLAIHKINLDLEELRYKLNNKGSNNNTNDDENPIKKSIENIKKMFEKRKEKYADLDEFLNDPIYAEVFFKISQECLMDVKELKKEIKKAIQK